MLVYIAGGKLEQRRRAAEHWYRQQLTTAFMRTVRYSGNRREVLFQRSLELHNIRLVCNGRVRRRTPDVPATMILAALAQRLTGSWGCVTANKIQHTNNRWYDAFSSVNELETPDFRLRISLETVVAEPAYPNLFVDVLLNMYPQYATKK